MKCINALLTICTTVAAVMAQPVHSQETQRPLVFAVAPLNGGVYWVKSSHSSNSGFIVGDKGVIVVDAQRNVADVKPALAEIAKITPKAITDIIITHADPDHIAGLPAYPAGINIIAQENVKPTVLAFAADATHRSQQLFRDMLNFLPTRTIAGTESMVIDGVPMVLMHVAPAHTNADLIVYLPNQKIVFAGDVLTPQLGRYPVIHLFENGHSFGWLKFVEAMLKLDADTFVPGHGDAPMTKAQLQAQYDGVLQRRAEIKALVEQNKSLEEIKRVLSDPPGSGGFPTFVETTYEELDQRISAGVPVQPAEGATQRGPWSIREMIEAKFAKDCSR